MDEIPGPPEIPEPAKKAPSGPKRVVAGIVIALAGLAGGEIARRGCLAVWDRPREPAPHDCRRHSYATFTPPDGAFTVDFPGRDVETIGPDQLAPPTKAYRVTDQRTVFMVGVTDVTELRPRPALEDLAALNVKAFFDANPLALESVAVTTVERGAVATATGSDRATGVKAAVKARVHEDGPSRTVFVIAAMGKAAVGIERRPCARRFLESFRIRGEPAARPIESVPARAVLDKPLGIETAAGAFTEVVPAGRQLPHTWSETFANDEDNQDAISIALAQRHATGPRRVAAIHLYGLPPRPRGMLKVTVTFRIDAAKRLHLTAAAPRPGYVKQFGPFPLQ